MSELNYILKAWPGLKEDLVNFLSDTDAWIIDELKKARKAKNWDDIDKVIDIMESVHAMSHQH
jgi:flagellin-specific chaperone FliS